MAKGFGGSSTDRLPAERVEPYRLWFEFLKLALIDPTIRVDKRLYRAWGDVASVPFDDWWSTHWRKLFAIDAGVRILGAGESLSKEELSVVVRLPLSGNIKRTLSEVRSILLESSSHGDRFGKPRGRFALSKGFEQGFLKKLNAARCMLRLYGMWLSHDGGDDRKRIENATLRYFDWADAWDQRIRERNWKRPRPYFPGCFRTYAAYIRDRRAGIRRRTGQASYEGNAENARRQVVRYIKKARTIAANVGRGEFPGKY
jgi:hypothetical protein